MPLSSVVGASSILKPGVCTSTTRPAAPFEGQTIYETDTDQLLTYNGSGWKPFADVTASTNGAVLQVVSTTKTDTFTTTSTTFADVTGLSVSITPSSTSSKIMVLGIMYGMNDQNSADAQGRVVRDSTAIFVGDAAGSRTPGLYVWAGFDRPPTPWPVLVLDSPASTSSLTYKYQLRNITAGTAYVNRGKADVDSAGYVRTASSITVMEISG